jgi:OmpA-OmpF porin, OOP family
MSGSSLMPGTTRGHVGFGKVGTTYAWTGQSVTAPGMSSGDEHNFGLAYGVGAGFNLTANVQLVGEWEQHRLDFRSGRENVSMYSLGLRCKF